MSKRLVNGTQRNYIVSSLIKKAYGDALIRDTLHSSRNIAIDRLMYISRSELGEYCTNDVKGTVRYALAIVAKQTS